MKLAIYFGDNDFTTVYIRLAEVIYAAYKEKDLPSKEVLSYCVKSMSSGMAHLFQNRNEGLDLTLEEYLEPKVFLYDEVDEFLSNHCPNSEVVVIDSRLDFPGNNPIYVV
jgi:hypothetical protein